MGVYSLYTYVVKKVKDVNNVTKNIFRILEKAHAYFQTILKGCVSFQKDQPKIVGGVARGMCIFPIHFGGIMALKRLSLKCKKTVTKIISAFCKKHMYIFRPSLKHL